MNSRHGVKGVKKAGAAGVRGRRRVGGLVVAALLGGVTVGGLGLHRWRQGQAHSPRVYTSAGLDGWVAPETGKPQTVSNADDPLSGLRADYRAGKWADVDREAANLMEAQQDSADAGKRQQAGQAELLAAYASAWRKDYATAQARFLRVQRLAGELPDHGARKVLVGEAPLPTLEEEAGFQHAVCVGAAGDKGGAEAEYDDFMRQYPQSILVHAAIKRVTRLHGGDIPADAEELWTQAMRQQKAKQERAQREGALCGPECLAEVLRRQGKSVEVHALAGEMQTGADGTSLRQLARVAKAHGWAAVGVELTQAGLGKQALPLIALLKPGHYVLVERVSGQGVRVWNPDAEGTGRAGTKTYTPGEWQGAWTGIGVCLNHD